MSSLITSPFSFSFVQLTLPPRRSVFPLFLIRISLPWNFFTETDFKIRNFFYLKTPIFGLKNPKTGSKWYKQMAIQIFIFHLCLGADNFQIRLAHIFPSDNNWIITRSRRKYKRAEGNFQNSWMKNRKSAVISCGDSFRSEWVHIFFRAGLAAPILTQKNARTEWQTVRAFFCEGKIRR